MSWAKLDDQYPDHPKIIEVGPLGMALHTAAICYCARYLTDGFVPAAMITRLINLDGIQTTNNGVSNAVTHKEVIDNLTRVGLLEMVQGGYMIHDFLKYNPKGEDVKRERAENAARQAAWKAKHGSNGVSNGGNNRVPSPSPYPSKAINNNGGDPEIIGSLVPLSVACANILHVDEYTGGAEQWNAALIVMQNQGVTTEIIEKAVYKLNHGRKKYTLIGPQSILQTCLGILQERNHQDNWEPSEVNR